MFLKSETTLSVLNGFKKQVRVKLFFKKINQIHAGSINNYILSTS